MKTKIKSFKIRYTPGGAMDLELLLDGNVNYEASKRYTGETSITIITLLQLGNTYYHNDGTYSVDETNTNLA